jgi:NitT/TauT family transport system permease protein/sulfonate transport system permease protein
LNAFCGFHRFFVLDSNGDEVSQSSPNAQSPTVKAAKAAVSRFLTSSRTSGVLLVLLLLGLWEGSVRSGLVQSTSWPAFSDVVTALTLGIANGELLRVIGSTLLNMSIGYAIGTFVGVPLGFAIALWPAARLTLMPTFEVLRTIPIPAIIPPLIFLLGVDSALKLFCVTFATFFPITLNTMAGIVVVEPVYKDVARTFGVSRAVTLRRIIFPAALPYILAGLRTSLAIALVVTVVSEMIAGQHGVGFFLLSMEFAMRSADMYAAVVLLACSAYAINRIFIAWESRAIRWARLREVMGNDS